MQESVYLWCGNGCFPLQDARLERFLSLGDVEFYLPIPVLSLGALVGDLCRACGLDLVREEIDVLVATLDGNPEKLEIATSITVLSHDLIDLDIAVKDGLEWYP